MVSSKPLPPIPTPPSEKRGHHLFSSVTHHRKKSESSATAAVATNTATTTASSTIAIPTATATTIDTCPVISPFTTTTTNTESSQQPTEAQPIPASNSFLSFLTSAVSTIRATHVSSAPVSTRSSSPAPSTFTSPTDETASSPLADATNVSNCNPNAILKSSMVTLDQRSFQHLRAIARQSIASSCLTPEYLWVGLLMDMLQKLAINVSDAWHQIEASFESMHHQDALSSSGTATAFTEKNVKEKPKDKAKDKERDKEKTKEKEETKNSLHFGYGIQLVKNISTTQECTFHAGQFRGESILLEERTIEERNRPPKQEPIQLLLGGTIVLAASAEDLIKVERILELLVFALCSMQLEMYLMRDHNVVRHESSLFSLSSHDLEPRKPSVQQQQACNNSKRSSKGSMIFSWLSRGTLPAKYKKGTTQLSAQLGFQSGAGRDGNSSGQTTATPSLAEDLGIGDDLHACQNYRFAKIIQQIDKAIISVSPDVSFPPPHLLLRLRDEEAVGPNSKRKSYTWEDIEFVAKKIGFGNRIGKPKAGGPLGQIARFGTAVSATANQIGVAGKGIRLPIDSRAGLEHLMTNKQPRPDSATDFYSEEFAPFLSNNKTMAPGPRPLCDHTISKDAITRCFIYRGLVVNFEVESIDLFEMRIPRLQVNEDFPIMPRLAPSDWNEDQDFFISNSTARASSPTNAIPMLAYCDYITDTEYSNQVNSTRLEIMHFYESCKKIIVAMEEHFGETKSVVKRSSKQVSITQTTSLEPSKKEALNSLDELGDRWKTDEFDLYDQLKRIPITRLNDLRNRFKDYIKRTIRSMEAWQSEHCPELTQSLNSWTLPEYFGSDILHIFPRSSVILREDEPSSIIASTLSSMDYLTLLSPMCNQDINPVEAEEVAPRPPEKDVFKQETVLSVPTPGPLRTSRSAGSATLATRKSGSSDSEASTAVSSAPYGSPDKSDMASQTTIQDDDNEDDEDEDDFLVVDGYETTVKFVQTTKLDIPSMLINGTMSPRSTIGIHFGSGRHGKNSTLALVSNDKRTDNIMVRPASMMALDHSMPVFTSSPLTTPSESNNQTTSFFISPPDSRSTTPTPGTKSKNPFAYHSLTSFSGTMKGLSLNSITEKIGSGFSSYGASSTNADKSDKEPFKLDCAERTMRETYALEQELESGVRSPHLKARFSHGKTSFSCTVYYAAEFDTLRRRCGIHQNYVQSLSRCKVWNANGGKSKSSFHKTKDDRFVVKQMVSSWNIAEKDELLKFAPKYFEYMEKTHEAPTVLAKIFGFYTLKIKNGQSGQVMKIDVLVMEHLFYNQKITRTFDLKGIQDRHVGSKPNATGGGSTTLWDGDFIEGRYRALLLIYSHSKKIIRDSLLNDTEFLAGANIMDYSLLVGVDDERKELVVGIVDFIGAYTWYKRIESKGKTTLRGAKDNVTVLPPQQYRARFIDSMERYFLAVPDKWSKTALEQENSNTAAAIGVNKANRKPTAVDGAIIAASTTLLLPSTIPEGSKESLSIPITERSLKEKTSGYLEKGSKIITALSHKSGVGLAAAELGASTAVLDQDEAITIDAAAAREMDFYVKKLPRVFYPLN
ncbi:hypothetical protein FBU30_004405 [Linnemannia zychae]|nr:hypothetical protein FBU30_004405 [Linnemannia zychae]